MTLQDCKEIIAKKEGFNTWKDFGEFTSYADDYDISFNEAAELYASQKAKEAFEVAREKESECGVWNCEGNVMKYTDYEQFKNSTI